MGHKIWYGALGISHESYEKRSNSEGKNKFNRKLSATFLGLKTLVLNLNLIPGLRWSRRNYCGGY